jgi:NADPH:quinone reductase-like Zn-dependent oxidoreductase
MELSFGELWLLVLGVNAERWQEQARGADEVVDYTREDFTRRGQQYDLISLRETRRVLAPNGTLVMVGVKGGRQMAPIVARLLTAVVWTRFANKKKMLPFLAKNSKEDLMVLKELIEAGKVRPVIDRTYPLSETADAMRYLEDGHARGKVVITV